MNDMYRGNNFTFVENDDKMKYQEQKKYQQDRNVLEG